MSKGKVLLGVVLVAVCAALFYLWSSNGDPEAATRLAFSGNVELKEVDIAFKIPGKLVELRIDEGDSVEAGMLVARLDDALLLKMKEEARIQVLSLESKLKELETLIMFRRQSQSAQLEQRKAEVQEAELVLKTMVTGSRDQEIQAARAAVSRAQAEADRSQKDWARAQELYGNEDISTEQFERSRSVFEASGASLKQAQEQLSLVEEGPRVEDIERGKAAVSRAEAGLKAVEVIDLDIRRNEQGLKTILAEIEGAQARINTIDTQLTDTVAYSPVSGVVLATSAEQGEVLAAGTVLASVGDMDHPWIRGYVPETELGRVRLGQAVTVTTDSFPGKTYPGKITFLSSEAEFTPKQIQTPEERVKMVYRIKVEVENPNHELKLNMPVDAEIILE